MVIRRDGTYIYFQFSEVERRHKHWDECREYIKNHFKEWTYDDDIRTWIIEDSDMNLEMLRTILKHFLGDSPK